MFGWFSPRCPLKTWEKTWTEVRMRWLAEQFGIDRLLDATVVLPTEEFFPESHTADLEGAQRFLNRLCRSMEIDPRGIDLEVCEDVQMPGAAGHYEARQRPTIRVAASQLADPQRLLATLAHELSHELLLGRGLLDPVVWDHEWVTDLLPVFLGLGVFAANSVLQEACGQAGTMSWWTIGRQGYLPARIFGYAFALFAFVRGEDSPAWAEYLRLDAAAPLKEGLRYLNKTGDSLFHPDTIQARQGKSSTSELLRALREGTLSGRMAALWELHEQGTATPEVVEAVTQCLGDRDPDIPGEAARVLSALGPAAAPAVPLLVKVLGSSHATTRAGAALALGELGLEPDFTVPELTLLLEDRDLTVVQEAARALGAFGRLAEPAARQLLNVLRTALIDCDHPMIELLASVLVAVAPDAERQVRQHFAGDEEFRRMAVEALREEQGRADAARAAEETS